MDTESVGYGKRFSLDGERVDVAEFIADNAEDFGPEEIAAIAALAVGESLTFGGGAFGAFVLRREPLVFKMEEPTRDAAEDRAATLAARFTPTEEKRGRNARLILEGAQGPLESEAA